MSKYEEYIERYKRLHMGEDPFIQDGQLKNNIKGKELFSGIQFIRNLIKPLEKYLNEINRSVTLLDYGCGKGMMPWRSEEGFPNGVWGYFKDKIQAMWMYDPAVPQFSKKPPSGITFDIVSCADVLEHIPEEYVDMVLKEIDEYTEPTNGIMLLSISGVPAVKSFYNGENFHITVRDNDWWKNKIESNSKKQFILVHKNGKSITITDRLKPRDNS